jgi:ribosomal protein L7/L12
MKTIDPKDIARNIVWRQGLYFNLVSAVRELRTLANLSLLEAKLLIETAKVEYDNVQKLARDIVSNWKGHCLSSRPSPTNRLPAIGKLKGMVVISLQNAKDAIERAIDECGDESEYNPLVMQISRESSINPQTVYEVLLAQARLAGVCQIQPPQA